MRQMATHLCQTHGISAGAVTQIGLGLPGSVDKASVTLMFGTNLGMNDVCFAEAFRPDFTCPVVLENDANCAALGEVVAGAGRGSKNAVMVTLGTGVGGGIVIGGELYTGFNDVAGEIGHMVVAAGGCSG